MVVEFSYERAAEGGARIGVDLTGSGSDGGTIQTGKRSRRGRGRGSDGGRIHPRKRSRRGFAKEEVELIQKASSEREAIFSYQITFLPNFYQIQSCLSRTIAYLRSSINRNVQRSKQ